MLERLEAFREEAELLAQLPDFPEIERRGRSRRRRHRAAVGAVAASVLAGIGLLGTLRGPDPGPQPAEDSEPSSSGTPYPAYEMVTLPEGTYEITTSPDGLRPAMRFTLPPGWNAGPLPERLDGMSKEVTHDAEVNKGVAAKHPDWYVAMLGSDVQWLAQRGCSDVEVTDAASLVRAFTNVPGLRVTSSPESTVRFGHPAVHLRLREQGDQAGPCWRRSIFRSAAYGYLTHGDPGATYDLWVVDVKERPVLLGATWARGTPRAEVDAVLGIVDSVELLDPE